jgi:hypothetical protein
MKFKRKMNRRCLRKARSRALFSRIIDSRIIFEDGGRYREGLSASRRIGCPLGERALPFEEQAGMPVSRGTERQWVGKVRIKRSGAAVLERGLSRAIGCALIKSALPGLPRFIGCAFGERGLPFSKNRRECLCHGGGALIVNVPAMADGD